LPGHLFIHVDLNENPPSFFQGLPGSRSLVMDGAQPTAVPDTLIAAIRRLVDQINATSSEEFANLPAGDALAKQDFPFTGYEILFYGSLSDEDRVLRFISLLRCERPPVELPDLERNL